MYKETHTYTHVFHTKKVTSLVHAHLPHKKSTTITTTANMAPPADAPMIVAADMDSVEHVRRVLQ